MVAGTEVSEVEGAATGLLSTEDVMTAVAATAGFSSTGDVALVVAVSSPTAFTGSGDTVPVGKGGSTSGEHRGGSLVDVPDVVVH
jgi:hypothetical protein